MAKAVENEALKNTLRAFIETDLLYGEDSIDDRSQLVSEGILDSVSAVSLVAFVEDEFGLRVGDGDIASEDLADLDSLSRWVERLRAGGGNGGIG